MNISIAIALGLLAIISLTLGCWMIGAAVKWARTERVLEEGWLFVGIVFVLAGLVQVAAGYLLWTRSQAPLDQPRAIAAAMRVSMPAERPRLTQTGCAVASDMVLVARALSASGLNRAYAGAIMSLVYAAYEGNEATRALLEELTDYSFGRPEAPLDLSRGFLEACLAGEGVIGPILGTGV